jgi:hypothetical protein
VSKSRVAKRIAALTTGLVALVAAAPSAFADSPPGFVEPGWVAFTLSSTSFPASRTPTSYPVTVNRTEGGGFDPSSLDWGVDGLGNPIWWPDITLSGYHLVGGGCPISATTCPYTLSGGNGTFDVRGGIPVDPEAFPDTQVVTIPDAPVMNVVFPSDLQPTPAGVDTPGTVTIDMSGSSDSGNPVTYSWKLTFQDGSVVKVSSLPSETFPLTQDGTYTLSVTVTSTFDGYSPGPQEATFVVGGMVAPAPGPSGGGPAPTPDPVPSAVTPKPAADVVTFAPLRRVPSALNGGTNGGAQVIWLWRPDWFTPEPLGPRSPRTATAPRVKAESVSVVTTTDPEPDSSATPWLAGLAVFGVAGIGLMAMRRRRMHYLDP